MIKQSFVKPYMRVSLIGSPATLNIVPFSRLMKLKNQPAGNYFL